MPANTYTLIEKLSVGAAGATSLTFTSIPQTYTDLVVKISARTAYVGLQLDVLTSMNGSVNQTNWRILQNNGSGAYSVTASNTDARAGVIPGTTVTANAFGSAEVYIPNYTGSTQKSYSSDTVYENNATDANGELIAGLYTQTTAVTSIQLSVTAGNSFAQYTTAYLYGIAKEGVSPGTSSAPYATGGDSIVFDGTYWIHTFTSSGTFTPRKALSNVDYLVVAGGGGAGSGAGGGRGAGGAGGLRSSVSPTGGGGTAESKINLNSGTAYTVTIGAAGGGGSGGNAGAQGTNSSISGTGLTTITSTGGGGGGSSNAGQINGGTGGSGGGGGLTGAGAAGTANQGYAGAGGNGTVGGGGGGAGGAGGTPTAGVGVSNSISGTATTYAVGGTGGNGGTGSSVAGAGGSYDGPNANGYAGIVIVRYAA